MAGNKDVISADLENVGSKSPLKKSLYQISIMRPILTKLAKMVVLGPTTNVISADFEKVGEGLIS